MMGSGRPCLGKAHGPFDVGSGSGTLGTLGTLVRISRHLQSGNPEKRLLSVRQERVISKIHAPLYRASLHIQFSTDIFTLSLSSSQFGLDGFPPPISMSLRDILLEVIDIHALSQHSYFNL